MNVAETQEATLPPLLPRDETRRRYEIREGLLVARHDNWMDRGRVRWIDRQTQRKKERKKERRKGVVK